MLKLARWSIPKMAQEFAVRIVKTVPLVVSTFVKMLLLARLIVPRAAPDFWGVLVQNHLKAVSWRHNSPICVRITKARRV